MTGDKRNTDNTLYRDVTLPPACSRPTAAVPQHTEGGGGITVDSLIWSITCAISATDPVQSDQGLKLDSAPLPQKEKKEKKKTPGNSSKHGRRPKKSELVWPSAHVSWEIKPTFSGA